jgi:hypothetical protein
MRRFTPLVVGLAVGFAGGYLAANSTGSERTAFAAGEVLVDVPHPTDPYGRVRAPLEVHRVTTPDGEHHDTGALARGREWVVRLNGVTYRGTPADGPP